MSVGMAELLLRTASTFSCLKKKKKKVVPQQYGLISFTKTSIHRSSVKYWLRFSYVPGMTGEIVVEKRRYGPCRDIVIIKEGIKK